MRAAMKTAMAERQRIVDLLALGPKTARELMQSTSSTRDQVNWRLKALKAAGIIVRGEQVAKPPPNYPIEYAYMLAADVKPIVKPYSVWDWLGNRGK